MPLRVKAFIAIGGEGEISFHYEKLLQWIIAKIQNALTLAYKLNCTLE